MRYQLHARRADEVDDRIQQRAVESADRMELVVRRAWNHLLLIIQQASPANSITLLRDLPSLFHQLGRELTATLTDDLPSHYFHGWESAARLVRYHLAKRPTLEAEGESPLSLMIGGILRPPSIGDINGWVYRWSKTSTWADRISQLTSLVDPSQSSIGTMIAQGALNAETPEQIARRIRPIVQGVQTSARRIARFEAVRIAHTAQMDAYDQLGDMVIGYQIHATLDDAVRPEHRRRDGTKYFKTPISGQKSVEEMPRPPLEADGAVAFNCRCYLTPILANA